MMMFFGIFFGLIFFTEKSVLASRESHQHTNEEKLVRRLMRPYERSMRPVFNHTDTVTVRMSATLSQIIDVDLRQQKIISTIWLDHVN